MDRLATLILGLSLFVGIQEAAAAEPRGMLYQFGAKWCGPCQQVTPVVEKLAREGLPVRKIDIDEQRSFADQHRIERIPTFVLVIDGREADRHVGMLTEADMRRMLSTIPASSPEIAQPVRPPASPEEGRMQIPVHLGEPAPLTRPTPLPGYSEETRVAQAPEEPRRGIRDLWPFGRKETPPEAPAVVRGNNEPLRSAEAPRRADPSIPEPGAPLLASVRIRVINPDRVDLGSGTVISSTAGMTQILTCEHIFKEYRPETKIEVDLFENGRPTQFVARLVHADRESDLGLIAAPTAEPVPVCPVGRRESAPQAGEAVVAIGCSGGEEPTQQQLEVTNIDLYDGPHNLLCTGLPVSGRSGGGLFNARGEIVGVCSAADKDAGRGFYSGLFAIHKLLDDCSLTALYNPPPTAPEARVAAAEASVPATAPPIEDPRTAAQTLDIQAGNAEVVVLIRDRSQPEASNRIVIFHSPSPKFYAYLNGEVADDGLSRALGSATTDSGRIPRIGRERREAAPPAPESLATQQRTKEILQPTTYSQPLAQRYVRTR